MFTGLIEALGTVVEAKIHQQGRRYRIATHHLPINDLKVGDSIAVNGVCLTIEELLGDAFCAFVSQETLVRTTLGDVTVADLVNLERPLTPTKYLGGHLVSGHVDGKGTVINYDRNGEFLQLSISIPHELAKYIAYKGSVCVDGVSLTVNKVEGVNFSVTIIPHTVENTTIKYYGVGTAVNIEVDIVARYLDRLLNACHYAPHANTP